MRNYFSELSTISKLVGGLLALLVFYLGAIVGYIGGQWDMTGKVVTQDPSSGRFLSEPQAVWLRDGRDMQLTQDFVFVDSQGHPWLAEKGTIVNGASIPSILWSVIGSPFTGKYRNASIVHDAECEKMRVPAAEVHRMFYDACLAGGVPRSDAKMLYWAVANHGPQWRLVEDYPKMGSPNGQITGATIMVPKETEISPLSKADLNWANEFFATQDPPVEAIPGLRPRDHPLPTLTPY